MAHNRKHHPSGRTLGAAIAEEVAEYQAAARRVQAQAQGRIEPQSGLKSGTVLFWKEDQGYGFIQPDGGGDNIHVHFTNVIGNGPGHRNLAKGQRVVFQIARGPKGLQARNVQKVGILDD